MNAVDVSTVEEVVENLFLDDAPATHTDSTGRMWRLKVEPDEMDVIDSEEYGMVSFVDDRPYDQWERQRPAGFDGNAEKFNIGRSQDTYWWQPPADLKRGTEMFTTFRTMLMNVLEFGYSYVVLESGTQTDAYGRMVVDSFASVGGIEPFPSDEYCTEIVGDLTREILWELANRDTTTTTTTTTEGE